ncbi:MAG: protein kinase [Mariniblastus sp.]
MPTEHLTPDDIEALVTGRNQEIESSEHQVHLGNCKECQNRLESASAESWWWNEETRGLLRASSNLSDECGPLLSLSSKSTGYDPVEAEIETLVASFEPAIHPELLGCVGEYDVHSLIGVGGMGAVFKGFDRELNRPVAIKFLLPRFTKLTESRERFSREAKSIAAVCCDNVIPIYRINTNAKFPHFAMPLIAGMSLQQYVQQEGMLAPEQLIQIAIQVSTGLAAAHKQGLIHRDVKPANILLENKLNRVVVTDFGLARDEHDSSLTQTGIVAGTPQYMSPEQADGKLLDQRTDLFSLGSVMYFMATGQSPFQGNNQLEVLKNIRSSKQPGIRTINSAMPIRLEKAVDRLLEKDPALRFKSATEVEAFLTSYSAHLNSPNDNAEPKLATQIRLSRSFLTGVSIFALAMTMALLAFSPGARSWLGLNGPKTQIETVSRWTAEQEAEAKALTLESEGMNAYFAESKNVPTVRGAVSGASRSELSDLVIQYYVQVPSKTQETRTATIDRNGQFDLKLEYAFPFQQIGLKIGDFYHGNITVHRDLTISIDLNQLKKNKSLVGGRGIEFTGLDAEMADFLYDYRIANSEMIHRLEIRKSELGFDERTLEETLIAHREIFDDRKTMNREFVSNNPSEHAWILDESLQSSYYANLISVHLFAEATIAPELLAEILSYKPKLMGGDSGSYYHNLNLYYSMVNKPSVWQEVLAEVPTDDQEKSELNEFLKLVADMREGKAFDRAKFSEGQKRFLIPNGEALAKAIRGKYQTKLKSLKKLDPNKANAVMVLGAGGLSRSNRNYAEMVLPLVGDGWCKTVLSEVHKNDLNQYRKLQATIKHAKLKGTKRLGEAVLSVDEIFFFKPNHENAQQLADDICEAFPGKAIIVDFWSMSCGACLHDMQESKSEKEELAKLPVEVVYVCLDSDYEAWLERIVESKVKGYHLYLNDKLSAAAMEHFRISSFPSFLFIDQDRNQDPNLIQYIDGLAIETIKSRLK